VNFPELDEIARDITTLALSIIREPTRLNRQLSKVQQQYVLDRVVKILQAQL
jgi:hypothetical protein